MSFRTRLTGFFVLIVIVPMIAFGFLVFRLISDSQRGKADARADGLVTAASSLYNASSADARIDAQTVGRALAGTPRADMRLRLVALDSGSGLAGLRVTESTRTIASLGSTTAIAPGSVTVREPGGAAPVRVVASELTATQYTRELAGPGVGIVVSQGRRTLASTLTVKGVALPAQGNVTIGGIGYRAVTRTFSGIGAPVRVTVLSDLAVPGDSVGSSRLVAAIFIAGFLFLAFGFSVLASKALQGQIARFLGAAQRLAGGDFSSPVPIEGRDEFAALGEEFNSMSKQLATKIDELEEERARLRESLHRIGQTFASNLDRQALLELALQTAIDGAEATCGRLSIRETPDQSLTEFGASGSLIGFEAAVHEAEHEALNTRGLGEANTEGRYVASVALGLIAETQRAHGVIAVGREDRPFTDDDRDLLRSLASQTTLALENVELHHQIQRQAVTDELTGLANHGRFQELLSSEIEQVRRYEHPVGLIMLDIDNFKSVNDTYGHPQGDVVLKHVARVLRQNSRDVDSPARYGGEEMALILPHTDLPGAHAIAERVRSAIEALHIPQLDSEGVLRVTASVGVAASAEGDKDGLIADADGALYTAKRGGKNRTVAAQAANAFGGE
jgi:diguanylate cyclase (GGDEF)-like protein